MTESAELSWTSTVPSLSSKAKAEAPATSPISAPASSMYTEEATSIRAVKPLPTARTSPLSERRAIRPLSVRTSPAARLPEKETVGSSSSKTSASLRLRVPEPVRPMVGALRVVGSVKLTLPDGVRETRFRPAVMFASAPVTAREPTLSMLREALKPLAVSSASTWKVLNEIRKPSAAESVSAIS